MSNLEAGEDQILADCMSARQVIREMYQEKLRKIYEWTLPEFRDSKRSQLK